MTVCGHQGPKSWGPHAKPPRWCYCVRGQPLKDRMHIIGPFLTSVYLSDSQWPKTWGLLPVTSSRLQMRRRCWPQLEQSQQLWTERHWLPEHQAAVEMKSPTSPGVEIRVLSHLSSVGHGPRWATPHLLMAPKGKHHLKMSHVTCNIN